jgi:Ca-activated chloride channel family protein
MYRASGVVLEPTPGDQTFKITQALDKLTAGGSTNGAAGIRLAYEVAQSAYIKEGVNRILLATDGDFNVGTTNFEQLIDLVETRRDSGIGLSTLGFGTGNYNDHLAEQLANKGNGMHAYIDTLNEANKVLVNQLSSTLLTIAKDVKIQLEFNPAVVSEYRLIGYENRQLRREDFNNDKIDAGEIGAGHTVTALYEITLAGSGSERINLLRYSDNRSTKRNHSNELALLRLRYKQPDSDTSQLIEAPVFKKSVKASLEQTTARYRFAAAVAGFGQQLRGGEYLEGFNYDAVLQLARGSRGGDPNGYRGEFIQLVQLARSVDSTTR